MYNGKESERICVCVCVCVCDWISPTSDLLPCSLCCSLSGLQAVCEHSHHLLLGAGHAPALFPQVTSWLTSFLCSSPRRQVSPWHLPLPRRHSAPQPAVPIFCITSYTFTPSSVLPLQNVSTSMAGCLSCSPLSHQHPEKNLVLSAG